MSVEGRSCRCLPVVSLTLCSPIHGRCQAAKPPVVVGAQDWPRSASEKRSLSLTWVAIQACHGSARRLEPPLTIAAAFTSRPDRLADSSRDAALERRPRQGCPRSPEWMDQKPVGSPVWLAAGWRASAPGGHPRRRRRPGVLEAKGHAAPGPHCLVRTGRRARPRRSRSACVRERPGAPEGHTGRLKGSLQRHGGENCAPLRRLPSRNEGGWRR